MRALIKKAGVRERRSTIMGIERRGKGNNLYYYRKRRIGSRVVSEYVGGGELAHLAAQLDAWERDKQDEECYRLKVKCAEIMAEDKVLADLGQAISTLVQGILLAEGYHTHKGQWRRKRGNQ
jgi:hypothetical protein